MLGNRDIEPPQAVTGEAALSVSLRADCASQQNRRFAGTEGGGFLTILKLNGDTIALIISISGLVGTIITLSILLSGGKI